MTTLTRQLMEISGTAAPGLLHYGGMLAADILEFGGNGPGMTRTFEESVARLGSLAERANNDGPIRFSVLVLDIQTVPELPPQDLDAVRRVLDEYLKGKSGLLARAPSGPTYWLEGVARAISCARKGRRSLLLQGRTSKPPGWIAGSVQSAVVTGQPPEAGVFTSIFAAGQLPASSP